MPDASYEMIRQRRCWCQINTFNELSTGTLLSFCLREIKQRSLIFPSKADALHLSDLGDQLSTTLGKHILDASRVELAFKERS